MAAGPRPISPAELEENDGQDGHRFWCVIDGFVCDATAFADSHPGGLRKLMSANTSEAGATGRPFGFSFSRGPNAHFPKTGQRFAEACEQYLNGISRQPHLPPVEVEFPPFGKITILGRLSQADE